MALTDMFAGDATGNIYSSPDGSTWSTAGSITGRVGSLVYFLEDVYACSCTDDIVYQCTDGSTWNNVDQVWGGGHSWRSSALCAFGSYIYVIATGWDDVSGVSKLAIRRSNDGANWSTVMELTGGLFETNDYYWYRPTFCVIGSRIYAPVTSEIFYPLDDREHAYPYRGLMIYGSTDGASWALEGENVVKSFQNPNYNYSNPIMAYANGSFLCGDNLGSIDHGPQIGFDEDEYPPLVTSQTGYVSIPSLSLYAGDWSYTDSGIRGGFCVLDGYIYQVGTNLAQNTIKILRSPTSSISWTTVYSSGTGAYYEAWQMCMFSGNIYAATSAGVLRSTDGGESFDSIVEYGIFLAIGAPPIATAPMYVTMF